MNRGLIPGFYFDVEKNKYFKIQANHVAPQGAKYSKGSIKVEQREAKKRRIEHKKNAKVRQQRVVKAGVLENPILGGTGLLREQGGGSQNLNASSQDAVLVRALSPRRLTFQHAQFGLAPIRVTHAQYVSGLDEVALATAWSRNGDWGENYHTIETIRPWLARPGSRHYRVEVSGSATVQPFSGPVQDFSVCEVECDTVYMAACYRDESALPGIYIDSLMKGASGDMIVPKLRLSVRDRSISIGRCAWAPNTHGPSHFPRLAFCGTGAVWVSERFTETQTRLDVSNREINALEWLDIDTLAYGVNNIQLWDIRSNGQISRFGSPRNAPLTGILTPSRQAASSNTLLASTNHAIHLYDRRYVKTVPVMSFRHVHQGSKMHFTSINHDLIAAADRDNNVNVYSLRTGSTVGQLARPAGLSASDMITDLRWCSDDRLMACQGGDLVEWLWSNQDEDV